MDTIYVPLFSALAGAIIGSATSIITILIQSKNQNKRELTKVAVEAAMEDHRSCLDLAKAGGDGEVAPLSAFIHFHIESLRLLEQGKLTADSIKKLKEERDNLFPK